MDAPIASAGASKVDLRLKAAPGVDDAQVSALVPSECYGQHGWEEGPEPHGRWLVYRITGADRIEVAERLAASALASGVVVDAEIRTMGLGKRVVINTRKVARYLGGGC